MRSTEEFSGDRTTGHSVPRPDRRRLLALVGGAAATVLAGCGAADDTPDYEEGESVDADGEERTAEETTAAAALAETELNDGLSPLDDLDIADHGFVVEEDFRRATVQGTVENARQGRLTDVEVWVRIYDDGDALLGRYADSIGDLDPGERWAFTVIVLESLVEIERYELAVVGRSE
ncbi:FxLYD domain-containing protein [Natronorarus salvus]|uniref:FxLYD domain-containing protein n=1 Tax=Natronorarus salvus TaxID=3117733 RepID=UPI002F261D06